MEFFVCKVCGQAGIPTGEKFPERVQELEKMRKEGARADRVRFEIARRKFSAS